MKYITKESLIDTLLSVGIEKNDTLLVHSDIASFGTTENFSRKEALNIFYEAFMEVLGSEGTLCVPAYFYEYARFGIPFDTALSPISKELGVFARYIHSLPESKRSCNPLAAVAAVGKNKEYICAPHSRHNYGLNSAFDKLFQLDAKIVLAGTGINALTFAHYVEYRTGQPYLYNKIYNIPVYTNGELIFDHTFAAVRYLNIDVEYKKHTTIESESHNDIFTIKKYLDNFITTLSIQKYVDMLTKILINNPYFCLDHKPDFPAGQIPNDGPVMKK